jgi:hypothetical protein
MSHLLQKNKWSIFFGRVSCVLQPAPRSKFRRKCNRFQVVPSPPPLLQPPNQAVECTDRPFQYWMKDYPDLGFVTPPRTPRPWHCSPCYWMKAKKIEGDSSTKTDRLHLLSQSRVPLLGRTAICMAAQWKTLCLCVCKLFPTLQGRVVWFLLLPFSPSS